MRGRNLQRAPPSKSFHLDKSHAGDKVSGPNGKEMPLLKNPCVACKGMSSTGAPRLSAPMLTRHPQKSTSNVRRPAKNKLNDAC